MTKKDAVNFMLSSVAAMVLFMGVFTVGPYLETRFWPAYSRFLIAEIEPYGDGQSKARFAYIKWRDCEAQGHAWFTGDLGVAYRQITVKPADTIEQPPLPRPLGDNRSREYILDVSPEVLRQGVFAEIYSRCHIFWTTRSVIYP